MQARQRCSRGEALYMAVTLDLIPLRAGDLKQYFYCPRVLFYHYILPVARRATPLMEEGKTAEADLAAAEKRRTLRRYGLGTGERLRGLFLHSARLGLTGKVDLAVRSAGELMPIEIKFTRSRPAVGHKYQLAAYALLLEDTYGGTVRRGFFYLLPRAEIVEVAFTPALRHRTHHVLARIRRMLRTGVLPPATRVRGRCVDCEFRMYCADIRPEVAAEEVRFAESEGGRRGWASGRPGSARR